MFWMDKGRIHLLSPLTDGWKVMDESSINFMTSFLSFSAKIQQKMKKKLVLKFTDESSVTFQLSVSGPGEFGQRLKNNFYWIFAGPEDYHWLFFNFVRHKLFDFSPGARGSLHNVKFLLCLSLKIGVLKVFSIMVTSPGIKGAKFHYKYAETVSIATYWIS